MASRLTRRGLMGAAAAGTAAGALGIVPAPAEAQEENLVCQDVPTPRGFVRTCTAGLPFSMIHIDAARNQQRQSQWCWAACIAMVFQYNDHPVSQRRIVEEAYARVPPSPSRVMLAVRAT
ncbi:MAG: twin-arginine translocation signal domain-containing protein [Myxococcales bacterium]|nr:twin-arginine translocation signal domain-containing protein [Myxococcales bacterium]